MGEPPAGGGRTVRGSVSCGFHSSTFIITQTARRAPPGSTSLGRLFIGEYARRSLGSITTPPWRDPEKNLEIKCPKAAALLCPAISLSRRKDLLRPPGLSVLLRLR